MTGHAVITGGAASSILVLNCGSSSIKFALFDASGLEPPRKAWWSGKVDGIGGGRPSFGATDAAAAPMNLDAARPYHDALARIRAQVDARLAGRELAAVAHRVVHGGSRYGEPVRLDDQVLADLRSYVPLAPLQRFDRLECEWLVQRSNPALPQVACFDTAFHQTMPDVEKMLPLPYSAWERGLRRYGFHGLSYAYVAIAIAERHGEPGRGRCIVAHLGSGASLCAMRDGKSVATSMGFSALDGLMMGTRCGALDPGAVIYLMEIEKLTLEQVGRVLYHESGLLGVSGVSSDPRVLLPQEASNARVRVALALYVRRIVREIGSLAAALGGLDMLVFTAGIGEHNPVIRERVCAGLGFLGVTLDPTRNDAAEPVISACGSQVLVTVEPTNEEWIAARDCAALLAGAGG